MKKHITILIVILLATSFLGCVSTVEDEPIISRDNGLAGIDGYRSLWQSKGSLTSGYDPQGFAWAQCTSYSAFAVRKYTSYANFSNSWKGLHFGNAAEWHIAAKQAGIRVDKTPAVGAVAQRLNGTWGHVAFVVAVNEDGTFVINEYDHVVRRGFSTRTARIGEGSHDFAQFLHFEKGDK